MASLARSMHLDILLHLALRNLTSYCHMNVLLFPKKDLKVFWIYVQNKFCIRFYVISEKS